MHNATSHDHARKTAGPGRQPIPPHRTNTCAVTPGAPDTKSFDDGTTCAHAHETHVRDGPILTQPPAPHLSCPPHTSPQDRVKKNGQQPLQPGSPSRRRRDRTRHHACRSLPRRRRRRCRRHPSSSSAAPSSPPDQTPRKASRRRGGCCRQADMLQYIDRQAAEVKVKRTTTKTRWRKYIDRQVANVSGSVFLQKAVLTLQRVGGGFCPTEKTTCVLDVASRHVVRTVCVQGFVATLHDVSNAWIKAQQRTRRQDSREYIVGCWLLRCCAKVVPPGHAPTSRRNVGTPPPSTKARQDNNNCGMSYRLHGFTYEVILKREPSRTKAQATAPCAHEALQASRMLLAVTPTAPRERMCAWLVVDLNVNHQGCTAATKHYTNTDAKLLHSAGRTYVGVHPSRFAPANTAVRPLLLRLVHRLMKSARGCFSSNKGS